MILIIMIRIIVHQVQMMEGRVYVHGMAALIILRERIEIGHVFAMMDGEIQV